MMLSWLSPEAGPTEQRLDGISIDADTQTEIAHRLAQLQQSLCEEREARAVAIRTTSIVQSESSAVIAVQMEQIALLQRENNDLNWRLAELGIGNNVSDHQRQGQHQVSRFRCF